MQIRYILVIKTGGEQTKLASIITTFKWQNLFGGKGDKSQQFKLLHASRYRSLSHYVPPYCRMTIGYSRWSSCA